MDQPEALAGRWRAALSWGAVALLLVLQYALFRTYALREITWAYPSSYDQAAYLADAYDTHDYILDHGLLRGLRYGVRPSPPTGIVFHLQGALLFLLLGASRLSALTLNFLHFALFQVVLFATLRWFSRRWSVAFLGLGLVLAALSPFCWAGGIVDFRMDFAAFCLFGVLLCLAVRSGLFASRRWAVAVGAAAAYLILFRFITAVYLAGIVGVFIVYLAARLWRRRSDADARRAELQRLTGILLAGLVVLLVTVPVVWYRWPGLKAYYVVGHLTGEEKNIRMQIDGRELLYYVRSLLKDHAGRAFLALAALTVTTLLTLKAIHRRIGGARNIAQRVPAGAVLVFFTAALVIPLAIPTAGTHRSPVVAGLTLAPLLWLVLALVGVLAGPLPTGLRPALVEHGLAALAVTALATAGYVQVSHYARRSPLGQCREDAEHIVELSDLIAATCRDQGWQRPVLLHTANVDYLFHHVPEVLGRERPGVFRRFEAPFGCGLFAVNEAEVLAAARSSHFVLVAQPESPMYPFDHSMRAALPALRDYCEQNLVRLGTVRAYGRDITLFGRTAGRSCTGGDDPGSPRKGT